MTPRLTELVVEQPRVTPTEAVVVVRAGLDGPPGGVEVRGKLVGPRRPGVATVEVAYPLRPVSGDAPVSLRAVIPEPNLWTPDVPFRYDGTVELWRDGEKLNARPFTVELRAK